jgi:hypothetical protein
VNIMSVYHKHMTQRVPSDPYWAQNCTAYCAAMAINDSVLGGLTGITGRMVRAMSSEPVPDPASPGLNLSQCVQVAKKLRVPLYDKTGQSWTLLRKAVGSGASRAIIQVEYDEIPAAFRCQQSSDFGHAVLAIAFDGDRIRVSDPLCDMTKWYPESAIRHAAEYFAQKTGVSGVRYAVTRVVPKVA